MTLSARKQAKIDGLPRYFTGLECKHGHIAERFTQNGACVSCARAYMTSERRVKYEADYYRDNKERVLKRSAIYHQSNRERSKENAKRWTAQNKEKRSAINQTYKAKRRSWEKTGASYTELLQWKNSQEKVCYWCGVDCEDKFHVDHIMPLSKGGKHEIYNLAISCQPCNSRKSSKLPEEFAGLVGRVVINADRVKHGLRI
jgi:5-methylcytosine-specific restriction endonuclease McrA